MAYQDPAMGSGQDSSTTDVAKEQAGRVGQTAVQAGGEVAQTTKEQVQNVVGEAKQQARDLVGEARGQVSQQAGSQKGRAVEGLRALGDELQQMAQSGGQSGIATEVARQVSSRTHDLADYLDRHEPADLLDNFRSYARRRPAVFLTGAALVGVVAGRLTRGLASSGDDSSQQAVLPSGRPLTADTSGYDTPYTETTYTETTYTGTGYEQPGGYQQPGYGQPDYQQPGYESGYEPAPVPGGFRAPDAPPLPGEYDPSLDPQQPPARGWTP